jgi:two-component sensor histidine kinase
MDTIARLIGDPILVVDGVVDGAGRVVTLNQPARELIGTAGPGAWADVFEVDSNFRALLSAASGSSDYVIGSVSVRTASGELRRFAAHVLMIERQPAQRFAIQLLPAHQSRFAELTRQVDELNSEIAFRQSVQAKLEETLRHNQTLFRELQHRVKNDLQMTLGLFSIAAREAADPAQRELFLRTESQLGAIVEAQRLMYVAGRSEGAPADQMLCAIANAASRIAGRPPHITCKAEPIIASNDVALPLALIANELLSNAIKHGSTEKEPEIELRLRTEEDQAVLEVADNGPGFTSGEASGRRASGLALVRGLCRQIGGRLDVSSGPGAVVSVSFPLAR